MAETLPPNVEFNKGIYVPQLGEAFLISKDANYDYYSTNSGMYPKNPGGGSEGGGGGGGGGDDPSEEIQGLKNRMSAVEETQDKQKEAAEKSRQILEDGYIEADDVEEVDNLISNQDILRKSQQNLLSTF